MKLLSEVFKSVKKKQQKTQTKTNKNNQIKHTKKPASIAFPFPELICIASCKFLPYKNSLKKRRLHQVLNNYFV
jgi:hypothetical protein